MNEELKAIQEENERLKTQLEELETFKLNYEETSKLINEIKEQYETRITNIEAENEKRLNEKNKVIKQLLNGDKLNNHTHNCFDNINEKITKQNRY